MNFTETEIKYLAGLFDADGSLSIKFSKNRYGNVYLHLLLELSAAKGYDRLGYLPSLAKVMGSCNTKTYAHPSHQDCYVYRVQARNDLNKLLPRLVKHMVIKGAHWKRLYDKYCEYRGKVVNDEVEELKEFSAKSRNMVGPVKPKNHPTWAWIAGYLDGDGSYQLPKKGSPKIQVKAEAKDTVGIELLQKAFGGGICDVKGEDVRCWYISLGKMNRGFALRFLTKVVKHSKLKKWKIEQLINFHSTGRND